MHQWVEEIEKHTESLSIYNFISYFSFILILIYYYYFFKYFFDDALYVIRLTTMVHVKQYKYRDIKNAGIFLNIYIYCTFHKYN